MEKLKDLLNNVMASLQGTVEEAKAVKEDILLREAQEETARECQFLGIEVKERELLKTEIASLRGTVEKVKDALEEVLCGMRELLSAMEVGEELGENKKVDAVLEAPTPPLLNSHLVVVKKIKAQQLWVPLGEVQPLFQVVEHCAPPLYTGRASGFGLLVYAETFRVHISLVPLPLGWM